MNPKPRCNKTRILVEKQIRCAIYTRKSAEKGLQQEFNSLDAQREAGEAFILSRRHEGWQLLPARYDDNSVLCHRTDPYPAALPKPLFRQ